MDGISLVMPDYLPKVHYKSLFDLERLYWWHVSRLNISERIIRDHFPTPSNLNVLDYGCGTGGFLHELNDRLKFKSCLGVDVSNQAIQYAERYGDGYASLKPGDFSVVGNRDLVLLMDVLEHIQDDGTFLRELLESLRSEACLLVSVPAIPFLFSSWDATLNHYRRYSKKSLFKCLSQGGGTIRYINYFMSYLVPPIFWIRTIGKNRYHSNNCEFPQVHPSLNKILLQLNRLEILISSFVPIPAGSTLFALIEK